MRLPADADEELALVRAYVAARDADTLDDALQRRLSDLFHASRPVLLAKARRRARSPERAEELAQEAMLVAHRRLDSFEGRARFRSWLLGIADGLARNAHRKATDVLVEDGVVDATDPLRPLLVALMEEERATLLMRAAQAALDEQEREVVRLRYVDDVPQSEITDRMGLDGSGARAILQRARRKLRDAFRDELRAHGHRTASIFLL